jgi:hypothetical protein
VVLIDRPSLTRYAFGPCFRLIFTELQAGPTIGMPLLTARRRARQSVGKSRLKDLSLHGRNRGVGRAVRSTGESEPTARSMSL